MKQLQRYEDMPTVVGLASCSFLETVSVKGAVWVGSKSTEGMVWAGLLNCSFIRTVSVEGAGWADCDFVGTVESDVEEAGSTDCDFLDVEVNFFLENNRFILRGIVRIVSKEEE
jgi:hypothetical protein